MPGFLVRFALGLLLIGGAGVASAQDPVPPPESLEGAFPAQKHFSPYAGRNFPTQVFWGDTHLHTGMSMDAGAFGARLTPEDAYRFARGEELTSSTGLQVKLARPLDFLVVADHSDNMGFFPRLFAGDPAMLADPTGRRWYDMIQAGGQEGVKAAVEVIVAFSQNEFPPALASLPGSAAYRSAWEETIEAAEQYNEPGRFTAFIGYEWTSNTGGNNLHRVVIYRDGAEKAECPGALHDPPAARQRQPARPVEVDAALRGQDRRPDARDRPQRQPQQRHHVPDRRVVHRQDRWTWSTPKTRAKWEPLYEATQIKGDGETHPLALAQRRVRRLRDLGPGQPRPERAQAGRHAAVRVRPPSPPARPAARAEARHQPLQVRHDRLDRQPHGPGHRRGGQLLRQALRRGAQSRALEAPHGPDGRQEVRGLGHGGLGLRRGVGEGEHPRGALRRHDAQGDLRDDRPAHAGALLRRLGLHAGRRAAPAAGRGGLRQGRAHGRRPHARRRPARRPPSSSPR